MGTRNICCGKTSVPNGYESICEPFHESTLYTINLGECRMQPASEGR